jgi:pilus assembly protein CpaB
MKRPVAFVVLAGVAALLASVLVYSALKKREAEVQKAIATTVEIVVAAHDMPLGTKIDPAAVKMVRWSRDSVPPGSFTSPGAVISQFVKSTMVENEPVVSSKLFMGDKTAGVLPLLIPAGMRAMSVPVDEVSDIAGFVLPHAKVDVLVALSSGGSAAKPISKVVLQDVEVLAVAQEVEGKKDEPEVVKVVTLLVSPQDAERLTLASHEGSLRLAMRNYSDEKIVNTTGADVDALLRGYSTGMPLLAAHQADSATHVVARTFKPTVDVEIMRDGKSRQSVSFVKEAALGPTSIVHSFLAKDTSSRKADAEDDASDAKPAPSGPAEPAASAPAQPDGRHARLAIPDDKSDVRAAFAPNLKTIDVP